MLKTKSFSLCIDPLESSWSLAKRKEKTPCPLLGTVVYTTQVMHLLLCSLAGPDLNRAQGRGRACKCQTDIGLRFNYFGIEVFFFFGSQGQVQNDS